MSSIEHGGLYPDSREGVYGSPLPEGAEPFVSGVQDQAMLDKLAAEHKEWMESARLPDGTTPEADDGLARLGLAFEGLALVRRPIHEVPGDPVKLVREIIEDRNLKRPSSGAPIL
jgi:hypothetical protein